MIKQAARIGVIALVLVAFAGAAFGMTGRTEARRNLGLRLLQGGMTLAGLIWIGLAAWKSDLADEAIYGLLLIVFGTGVTAIARRRPHASK